MARETTGTTRVPTNTIHDDPVTRGTTARAATVHTGSTVDVFDRPDKRYVTAPAPDPLDAPTATTTAMGSTLGWIVGAIVLIALLYLLFQWVF